MPYIKKQLNDILETEMMKEFFSKISETRKFNKSFNIADSLYSVGIKWENDENDEILVNNPKVENYAENLFLWAILFNRVEIAKICLPMIEVSFKLIYYFYILKIFLFFNFLRIKLDFH